MAGISVVIPTLNEEAVIGTTLEALKPQLRQGDEIIVVDSHSKDRTVEIARKFGCRIVFLPRCGIGRAKNEGAKKSKNQIVAMLDADGAPAAGWLARVRNHFENGAVAVVGLGLYQGGRLHYNGFARLVFLVGRLSYFFLGMPWLPANNSAIRKERFLKKGGYPNVVCEDIAFGRRAKGLDGVVYDADVQVILSTRRFEKDGFAKTVLAWLWSDFRALTGRGISSLDYKPVR